MSLLSSLLARVRNRARDLSQAVSSQAHLTDKLNLSIGVAIGSSIQIALFVIPLITILAWILGKPLLLLFDVFGSSPLRLWLEVSMLTSFSSRERRPFPLRHPRELGAQRFEDELAGGRHSDGQFSEPCYSASIQADVGLDSVGLRDRCRRCVLLSRHGSSHPLSCLIGLRTEGAVRLRFILAYTNSRYPLMFGNH